MNSHCLRFELNLVHIWVTDFWPINWSSWFVVLSQSVVLKSEIEFKSFDDLTEGKKRIIDPLPFGYELAELMLWGCFWGTDNIKLFGIWSNILW